METAGVRIDTYRMGEITARLADRVEELESRAYELAGEEFVLGSPQQLGRILFGGHSQEEQLERLFGKVDELITVLGLPRSLAEVGVAREDYLATGMDDYISKPINKSEVVAVSSEKYT